MRYRLAAVLVTIAMASRAACADPASPAPADFAACQMCHDASQGGVALVGPPLWGIKGRKAGTSPGFQYSKAMTQYGAQWGRANLIAFINAPQKVVPGTKMAFGGVTDPTLAAQVADYLLTLE